MADAQVIDFDDAAAKRAVLSRIGALRGRYRVEVVRFRPRRSSRANRYYWPCLVVPFAAWLSEQEPAGVPPEHAHEILKAQFLTVDVVDHATGQIIGRRVGSSAALDSKQFAEYCDRAAAWLAELGIFAPQRTEEDCR